MLNKLQPNSDLVTIILTTLNSEHYLTVSLESCLHQSYQNIEILVVDGGSTDKTLDIVRGFSDERIRIIHQSNNEGKLPGAINLGLQESNGEFITWTQDDCWYESNAIETLLTYLNEHPQVDLVYADYWDVDETGKPIKYQSVHPPEDILFDDVIRVCFLMRKEVYEKIGPQNPKHHPVHEVPWRIKVSRYFKISPLHIPLLNYIVREGSLTGKIGNRNLWWMTSKILLEEGVYDQNMYKMSLAQAEMNQAFIEFIDHGDYHAFWKYAFSGIRLNWRYLLDRGILKYLMISFLPQREIFREDKRKELREKSTYVEQRL